MAERTPLAQHPRLSIGATELDTLREPLGSSALREAARTVAELAEEYCADPDFDEVGSTHNAHLIRARRMQGRVVTLLVHWLRSGESRFRDATVAHIATLGRWEYWSWITWRRNDPRPDAIFDLSYGENSMTLALAFDLLADTLTDDERSMMVEIARTRSLVPFQRVIDRDEAWWLNKPDSNWNSVCAGGAGMLALAMAEEVAEAADIVDVADTSVSLFMKHLEHTDGGWPEGIGYWNYGMRYAFHYLLSHERATGRTHPALEAEPTRRTLSFPLDFCPHGEPSSFGDTNKWSPFPIHVAAARRLDATEVLTALADDEGYPQFPSGEPGQASWPHLAEGLLYCRDAIAEAAPPDQSRMRLYDGLGWARIADRWPDPQLYLSVRGGSSDVPHGHPDLLSYHVVVGDERLVENITPGEYLDTTFGSRRAEIFECSAHSKNVPLINGVGAIPGATAAVSEVGTAQQPAIRLDATEAMGPGRDAPLAQFCGRSFVMLGDRGILVLDRIALNHRGRVETRTFTRADVALSGTVAQLTGKRQQVTATFAANLPFRLAAVDAPLTTPGDEATMLRWQSPVELTDDYWMATVFVPGDQRPQVELTANVEGAVVSVAGDGWHHTVAVAPDLRPSGQ